MYAGNGEMLVFVVRGFPYSRRLRKKRVFSQVKKGQFSINQCPIEISLRCVELQIAIQSLICLHLHSLCLSDTNLVSLHFNFNLDKSYVSQIKGISNSILERSLLIYFPNSISNSISCRSKLSSGQRPIAKQLKKRL